MGTRLRVVVLVIGALTFLALLVGVSQAQTRLVSVSATSGTPGSVIAMRSVTPCVLPVGVAGPAIMYLVLSRNGTVITSANVGTMSGGTWNATLTVPSNVAPGVAELSVSCYANGHTIADSRFPAEALTFTVTGARSVLARTGADSMILTICGASLLLLGSTLTAMNGRRWPRTLAVTITVASTEP